MGQEFSELIIFLLEKRRFAIPLPCVVKVIRAVAVTVIPDAGDMLHGVFDFQGELIPAVNLRKRFSLEKKEIAIGDRFVVVSTAKRKLALVVDEVEEIRKIKAGELSSADVFFPGDPTVQDKLPGLESTFLLRDQNGVVIIYDIEKLLKSELEIQLDQLIQVQQE